MYRQFKSRASRGSVLAFFFKNWWVGVLTMMAIAVHVHALNRKNQLVHALKIKVFVLKQEKKRALEEREQLKTRIQTEEDSDWTLLVLKRTLGLVEEGEIKVIFTKRVS